MGGADLAHAQFEGADLRSTNLKKARLSDAKMPCACFYGADLKDADFSSADLRGACLIGADNIPFWVNTDNLDYALMDERYFEEWKKQSDSEINPDIIWLSDDQESWKFRGEEYKKEDLVKILVKEREETPSETKKYYLGFVIGTINHRNWKAVGPGGSYPIDIARVKPVWYY
ncbi:MAG: pentapeptide repeat-containing protein [Cytophagales bacterium]|nr:pentapeptide repeat-containing protein [Cytophagales bacterium]